MRVFLQQRQTGALASRYLQLSLQPDLFGGWELQRESGLIGGQTRLQREQFTNRDEAIAALEKTQAGHLKRGFQLMPASSADTYR